MCLALILIEWFDYEHASCHAICTNMLRMVEFQFTFIRINGQ